MDQIIDQDHALSINGLYPHKYASPGTKSDKLNIRATPIAQACQQGFNWRNPVKEIKPLFSRQLDLDQS